MYSLGLRAFAEQFGDQLLILVHDEVCLDRTAAYRSVLRHLRVDEEIVPEDLERPRYVTRDRTVVPLDPEQRGHLMKYYGPGVEIVEGILGRELPSWHAGGVTTELAL